MLKNNDAISNEEYVFNTAGNNIPKGKKVA